MAVPSEAESFAFVSALKVAVGPMTWRSRGSNAAHVAQIALQVDGLRSGALICRQLPRFGRWWGFTLRDSRSDHLRWDYLPYERTGRRHRNPAARPPGVPGRDRSLVHEHPNTAGLYDRLSVPLDDKSTDDHEIAFRWFCQRANINVGDFIYVSPPEPQLTLLLS